MKLVVAAVALLSLGIRVSAHRLDEYLQATLISVKHDRIEASMRLIPGVAVSSTVLRSIDSNANGVLSESEQRAYVEHVLLDLALSVDGVRLQPHLTSFDFPATGDMKEGLGEIHINFGVDLRKGGSKRSLVFENHYQNQISAYLVNCLAPSTPGIEVISQNRNQWQSFYQLDYVQNDSRLGASSDARALGGEGPQRSKGGVLLFWFRGFSGMFRLGMQHIAEGNDHLLFLLALLLPAPLMAIGSRWAGFAGVQHSLVQTLKVVTAFTVGHSITLALAALGVVQVPARPIEVLIAVSIMVSAIHALLPLFPGREAVIAAFFGLIHGLAFAATLGQLGLSRGERLTSILGFNLGIETMQLMVVAATLPSLVLLGRTKLYMAFRVGGSLFALGASLGWIAERLLSLHSPVDRVVETVAQQAGWIAAALFLISLVCWSFPYFRRSRLREGIGRLAGSALERA